MTKLDEAATPQVTRGELAGLRVLVVDDTPNMVEALCVLLKLEGAWVETTTSGVEALRVVEATDLDLILSDISMPGMDGYEFLDKLRNRPRATRVPTVALTGFGRTEDVEQALAAGFITHLTKPVEFDQIMEVARSTPRQNPQNKTGKK